MSNQENHQDSDLWENPIFLFTPTFCQCTNHGACNVVSNLTICTCEPGWTGLSDFIDARGASCHINEDAVRYLWVVNLIVWLVCLLFSLNQMESIVYKFRELQKKAKSRGKVYKLWENKGLMTVLCGLFIGFPGMAIVAILRIAFPELRIGKDIVITLFWMYGRLGVTTTAFMHQPALMKQMLLAYHETESLLRRYDRYATLIAIIHFSSCFWILPVLITAEQSVFISRICFIGFCIHMSISYLLLAYQARVLEKGLYAKLTPTSHNNEQLKAVRDKLTTNQFRIFIQAGLQAMVYFIFTLSPPLWLTYDYILPITWIAPALLFRWTVYAIHNEKYRPISRRFTMRMSSPAAALDRKEPVAV